MSAVTCLRGESVEAGEEVYINVGQLEGDLILTFPFDLGVEEALAQASPSEIPFAPEYDPRHGILMTDASIGGEFLNTGDISAYHSAIQLERVNVGGSVTNTGTLTSDESGIVLQEIEGVQDFINLGIIQITDPNLGDGMSADRVTMSGVMENAGTITARYGMLLTDSSVSGFVNNGTINSYQEGMTALDTSGEGSISIDGNVGVGSEGSIITVQGNGIVLSSVQDVDSIINTGTITAGSHGIKLTDVSAQSLYNNGIITAGTYVEDLGDGETDANGSGIYLKDSNLQGNITNDVDDQIKAATHGIYLGETQGVTNVLNEGSINVDTDGIKLSGSTLDRIEEDNDFNSGNIINYRTGTITAGDDAIRLGGAIDYDDGMSTTPSLVEGDVVNMGVITADENAIDIDDSTVDGMISNSGTITSGDVTIDIG
ncbi:hypothetical protein CAPTEDRAFT_215341, partial [Capitella teleta]